MQTQLLEDYKEDIRKYADGLDQTRILNVFQHIPVQPAKDNKKFPNIESGKRSKVQRLSRVYRMAEGYGTCKCMLLSAISGIAIKR